MKRLLFFLSMVLIYTSILAQSDEWWPLEVGNKWQYQYYFSNYGSPSYHIQNVTVTNVETINGRLYYSFTGINGNKYSYDDVEKVIYQYRNGMESVLVNLSLPAGTVIIDTSYSEYSFHDEIIAHNFSFLGQTYYSKGISNSSSDDSGYLSRNQYFAKGIGQISGWSNSYVYDSELGSGSTNFKLISNLIKQDNGEFVHNCSSAAGHTKFRDFYTSGYSNSSIDMSMNLYHNLRKNVNNGYGYNYIKELHVEYYFKKYNDRSQIYTKELEFMPFEPSISTTFEFDSHWLDDGYELKFRLYAVDQSLIPDTVYYPDEGYMTYDGALLGNIEEIAPVEYSLNQNYPNPFNPSTTIKFALPVEAKVTVILYNALGQRVSEIVSNNFTAGVQQVNFNASELASGMYIYQISAQGVDGSNFVDTKKMILMK